MKRASAAAATPETESSGQMSDPTRLAVVISHPIQHFAPLHREMARIPTLRQRVFFCCDWGVNQYKDEGFGTEMAWDIPLVDGYEHEFLPIERRPEALTFRSVDNPGVGTSLERFRPDVVQVFGYAYRTNWRVAEWCRRRRTPLLLYSDSNITARTAAWKRLLKWPVVRTFYRLASGAVFIGDNNYAYHKRYGMADDRLFPAAYPIDRQRLLDSALERNPARRAVCDRHDLPRDAFLVLFSGKYIARKRAQDVVAAVQRLRHDGLNLWTVLVGEGPERASLERQVAAGGGATLTGFVNQSGIAEYYAAADVLAVTSDYDAHPLVVSEAACFGVPVVASDAIGCIGKHDTARPGENALVYRCGDVAALAESLRRLYDDPELRERMGRMSAEVAKSQDVVVVAQQIAAAAHALRERGRRQ